MNRSSSGPLLIVNADDLGRSLGINEGIFEAHARGIVTSATLMTCFDGAVEAGRELARYPKLGVGLHVTMSGALPLLPGEKIPSLVRDDGRFVDNPEQFGELDPTQVRAEIATQLERFLDLVGRLPSHFDGHHHCHRHPVVLDALISINREIQLPIRNASDSVTARLRQETMPTPDLFVDRYYGDEIDLDTLLEIIETIAQSGAPVTELMCHPGRVDAELELGSSYVHEREVELAVLCDPRVRQAIEEFGLRLATYADIPIER